MRFLAATALCLAALGVGAQTPELQRAVIQRDQQSAEFAARLRGGDTTRLEQLHGQQVLDTIVRPPHPDPQLARELRPYQRQQMSDERALTLSPPVALSPRPAETEPQSLAHIRGWQPPGPCP